MNKYLLLLYRRSDYFFTCEITDKSTGKKFPNSGTLQHYYMFTTNVNNVLQGVNETIENEFPSDKFSYFVTSINKIR